MNITWNAEQYTSGFPFVYQYGDAVTQLITADRGSSVLDLGCGNGVLSKTLKDKGYVVTGLDASKEMLAAAKSNYPDIAFMQADATDFNLPEPVDVVFSNAVFHWIDRERQPEMLQCVHAALKENGQFVFEFGGHGNNRHIHQTLTDVFAEYGYKYQMPFYFPTVGEYATLLENAGFTVKYALLFDRPTQLEGENGLEDWIRMFIQTPFAVVEEQDVRDTIIRETVSRLQSVLYWENNWYADYVRIRMKATP
ncbi:MAG: methyltransferase domain-containing protein [Clostridium sp.]|nr:methyltransferase domain-containing protein [Acetatifactor muris]MCM1528173.1 methyltransferase domain-containing protein [Bacteroides sp.]MCM1564111.1 methyltransferase domain-containing protein [Clostridium sp.]